MFRVGLISNALSLSKGIALSNALAPALPNALSLSKGIGTLSVVVRRVGVRGGARRQCWLGHVRPLRSRRA